MFEFIGRKKRIASKSKDIGEYFGQELKQGRNKKDVAISLAEKMSKISKPKELEKVLDEAIEKLMWVHAEDINVESIHIQSIVEMKLMANVNGDPVMTLVGEFGEYGSYIVFHLTQGFGVQNCNTFLRSLHLGVDIYFETYRQYSRTIQECFDRFKAKQEAAA